MSALTLNNISPKIWIMLIVIGVMASGQQIFMALSPCASASSLALPLYCIPIGVLIGLLVFNEKIDFNFLIGTFLVVGSTLFILYRKRKNLLVRRPIFSPIICSIISLFDRFFQPYSSDIFLKFNPSGECLDIPSKIVANF